MSGGLLRITEGLTAGFGGNAGLKGRFPLFPDGDVCNTGFGGLFGPVAKIGACVLGLLKVCGGVAPSGLNGTGGTGLQLEISHKKFPC